MGLNAVILIFFLQLPYISIQCEKKWVNKLYLHFILMFKLHRRGVRDGIKLPRVKSLSH